MTETRHRMPRSLIALIVIFLVLMGWSAWRAAVGTSPVTDRAYYSHGLRYNETLLERRAAASLGWRTRVNFDGSTLTVALADRDGAPVTGARGSLTLFPNTGDPRQLLLAEEQPGRYGARIPSLNDYSQTAEVRFERDGARLGKRLLLSSR